MTVCCALAARAVVQIHHHWRELCVLGGGDCASRAAFAAVLWILLGVVWQTCAPPPLPPPRLTAVRASPRLLSVCVSAEMAARRDAGHEAGRGGAGPTHRGSAPHVLCDVPAHVDVGARRRASPLQRLRVAARRAAVPLPRCVARLGRCGVCGSRDGTLPPVQGPPRPMRPTVPVAAPLPTPRSICAWCYGVVCAARCGADLRAGCDGVAVLCVGY